MILSDREIRDQIRAGRIRIEPLPWDSCIQPASVDLRLGTGFRVFRTHRETVIDPEKVSPTIMEPVNASDRPFVLHPGEFALGATEEFVAISGGHVIHWADREFGLCAHVEGKSSLGRIGLMVHSTAGYIDPGFRGHITLELANVSPLPILLRPGMRICQLRFELVSSPPLRPYGHPGLGSHYQDSTGVVEAKLGKE